jgi:hypothetical protein
LSLASSQPKSWLKGHALYFLLVPRRKQWELGARTNIMRRIEKALSSKMSRVRCQRAFTRQTFKCHYESHESQGTCGEGHFSFLTAFVSIMNRM